MLPDRSESQKYELGDLAREAAEVEKTRKAGERLDGCAVGHSRRRRPDGANRARAASTHSREETETIYSEMELAVGAAPVSQEQAGLKVAARRFPIFIIFGMELKKLTVRFTSWPQRVQHWLAQTGRRSAFGVGNDFGRKTSPGASQPASGA